MRCKACDVEIEVKWRAVSIDKDSDLVILENLCHTCLSHVYDSLQETDEQLAGELSENIMDEF